MYETDNFYLYDESINYTDNFEVIEEQLILLNENIVESYVSIVNNSVNILEISIIFLGLFLGILISFIFGVVAFNE